MLRRTSLAGLVLVVVCVTFVVTIVIAAAWFAANWSTPPSQDQLVISWIAAVAQALAGLATVGVVLVALFLNFILDAYRAARFEITCSDSFPYQRVIEDEHQTISGSPRERKNFYEGRRIHVRLKVQNVGRSSDKCEVRIEQVLELPRDQGNSVTTHMLEPLTLLWIGRQIEVLELRRGAYDLVDLGVRADDFPQNFRLSFGHRGSIDLVYRDNVRAFRIKGAVYAGQAKATPFSFDLSWRLVGKLDHIEMHPA